MQKYDFHVSITYFQDNGHTSTGSAQACNSPIVILLSIKVFDKARFMCLKLIFNGHMERPITVIILFVNTFTWAFHLL